MKSDAMISIKRRVNGFFDNGEVKEFRPVTISLEDTELSLFCNGTTIQVSLKDINKAINDGRKQMSDEKV